MSLSSEIRSWVVASAATLCLCAIGYRVYTIPDLAPTVTKLNATLTAASTGLQDVSALVSHAQSTTDAATGVLRAATPIVAGLQTTESKLNDSIDLTSHRLNDLCPQPGDTAHPCGTLADANRTLAGFRDTSVQVAVSVKAFHQHEGDLFTQESEAYAALHKSVTDLDTLVSNPNLTGMLSDGKTITGNAAAVTTDGKIWVHGKLYPTKRKGFISGAEAVGDFLKHYEPPLF